MAGFGFSMPRLSTSALGGGAAPLSMRDKLLMFSAIAQGNPEAALQIPMLAAQRQQLQAQQGFASQLQDALSPKIAYQDVDAPTGVKAPSLPGFTPPSSGTVTPPSDELSKAISTGIGDVTGNAPQAPEQPPSAPIRIPHMAQPGLSINDPRLAGLVAQARNPYINYDIAPLLDVLKAQQPDVEVGPGGEAYNKKDPGVVGKVFRNPTAVNNTIIDLNNPRNENYVVPGAPVPGAMPIYDNLGHVKDWYLPSGATGAIAAAKNAEATGQKSAEARYAGPIAFAQKSGEAAAENPNVLETHDLNGVPTTMTRQQWLDLAGGGGGVGGDGGQPRGLRNNNPGNLRPLPNGAWDGQVGVDGGNYAQFATPEAGAAAAEKNLLAKQSIHGLQTLQQIIADPKWGWDPGNTGYAATVAKAVGVKPNQPINLADPNVRQQVLSAIFSVENGRQITAQPTAQAAQAPGFHGVNAADEKRVQEALDDAKQAEDVAAKARQYQNLNKQTYTGQLFNPVRIHIPLVGDVPINPISGLGSMQTNSQAMDNLSMQMATGLRAPGQRLTQAEIFQNLKTVPNRTSLPGQNDASANLYIDRAATKRAYASFIQQWLSQHGSLTGADEAWSRMQKGGGQQAAAQPRVRTYNPATGNLE